MTDAQKSAIDKLYDKKFREKYGMFSTIEENYAFIQANPKRQRGRDSIQWIAPYMKVLRRYARECSHVTEFGINQVNSTYALLAAKPRKLVSVDIDLNARASKGIKEFNKVNLWLVWAKHLAEQAGIEFTPVQGDDCQIDIEPTELLFIDSKHSEAHLRAELVKHKNLVSKYIIFHDTTLFADQLMPVIEALLAEGDFEIVEHHKDKPGLMVIKRIPK